MTQNCDLLRFIPGQPGYQRGMYKGTFLRYIERFKPPPSRSDSTRRFFGRLIVDWLVISPPPLDGCCVSCIAIDKLVLILYPQIR